MNNKNILIIAGVVLAVFLIWGLIGGEVSEDVGITCDFGIGEVFCWKWHKNVIGEIGEALGDFRDRLEG